jgi:SAM-dependent methyltransferase
MMIDLFDSAESTEVRQTLETHFDHALNLYKFWASPWTVVKAFVLGWARSGHPARLHYAWDMDKFPSLDEAIRQTTREAVSHFELDQKPQALIVEAGCGMGGCTTQLAAEHAQLRGVGVQLIRRQAQVAQQRKQVLKPETARRVNFLVGNNLRLPLKHEICEGVLAIETFCHIPAGEKEKLLRGVFDLLKPGGKLVIVDGYLLREPQGVEIKLMDRRGWTLPELVSAERQTAMAQAVGFKIKSVENMTGHVTGSIRMIYRIAWFCQPFIKLAHFLEGYKLRIPGVRWLFDRLGFSAPHALWLAQTCLAQKPLAEAQILGYFVHVFEKPAQA